MVCKILLLNQKGGVGKTTLADEITFALGRRGFSVAFISIDSQGGQSNQLCTDETVALSSDFMVIDTAGVLKDDTEKWCLEADIILVPVLPSSRDIHPTLRTINLIRSSQTQARFYVLVNQFYSFGILDRELMEFFEAENIDVLKKIPRSVALSQAAAREISVAEFDPKNHVVPVLESITDKLIEISQTV